MTFQYYKIYKPYGMLSQFTPEAGHETLASLIYFPKDVYPVGRLDHDSEGLLLLTNDKQVNHRLLHPKFQHKKTYWVQIEGEMNDDAIRQLQEGIEINLKGQLVQTKPSSVKTIAPPPVAERIPPVNYLKHPSTSWIELSLAEGKNRQVRKMTAKVGHPTLRLIRSAVEDIKLENMKPGDVIEMDRGVFYRLLRL